METSGAVTPSAIHPSDLTEWVTGPGPFATVYLTAEAAVENAAQRSQVRWKTHRDELLAAGAPEEVVAAVDPLVADAHLEGEGLGVIVRADGGLHVEHDPHPPAVDRAAWTVLPSMGQLLAWRQAAVPHVVVVADRLGADIVAVAASGGSLEREAGRHDRPVRKVGAGGWSQRRYQERAENTWERNADDAAAQVSRLAAAVDARFVAVAGDVRAITLLRDALPSEVTVLVQEVGGGRSADGSDDTIAAQVADLVDQAAQTATASVLDKFREERGQHDRAADGPEETIGALSAAQVDVLLVHDDGEDGRTAWFGPDPTQVALSASTLGDLGVDDPIEGRLVDVAVRAGLGTGAGIRMVPRIGVPAEGLGAVLRWASS